MQATFRHFEMFISFFFVVDLHEMNRFSNYDKFIMDCLNTFKIAKGMPS